MSEIVICFVLPPEKHETMTLNDGFVLAALGPMAEAEMERQGRFLADWLIDDLTPDGCTGLLTWEGECTNAGQMACDDGYEPHFVGRWRLPSADEMDVLVIRPVR